jgi:ABC-type Na+ efflux pump permease subunit
VTNLKTDPNNASYDEHDDIMYTSAIPFVLVHLACIAAIWTGITWLAVAICVVLYWLRILPLARATTDTFRIAPIPPAVHPSS